ncbi:MAG: FAD-dependent oxidoreductase [Kiritimatiellae bacterium]|nr:FAD-dependent oxidoreductase [Kiritimatiellia bacterium]
MKESGHRIAVVGAGVAGLTAAYILQRRHHVTVFEKNDYLGGHTHTLTLAAGPDKGLPVDTGFIVMNHRNYPLLTRLFEQLDVTLQDSDMSFSYWDRHSGLQYAGTNLNTLFGQRRNVVRPAFYRLLRDILRFYRQATADLARGSAGDVTLGEYLRQGGFSEAFVRHHIVPMGAAIWSTPCAEMMDFPALSFLHFFRNHGLLSLKDRPQWRTVTGGSHTYVAKMVERMTVDIRLNAPVAQVSRRQAGVRVTVAGAAPETFDGVVIGAHADQALAILENPTEAERVLLGAWRYQMNRTVLHTDGAVMPPLRRVWSSWNYTREGRDDPDGPATLSYWMNHLQRLQAGRDYFVSLNRTQAFPAESVLAEMDYAHPTYTRESMASQQELPALNGADRIWFCGSYFGYGFHEDGARSGVEVARTFGLDL